MAFRVRKSFRVAPGVRVNVSKTGIGASVGAGPARYSVHSSGRRTFSARTGIPGITYQGSSGGRGHTHAVTARARQPAAPHEAAKPGLFAPKGEKQLYKALKAHDARAIRDAGDRYPACRLASYALAGLLFLADDPGQAAALLDDVLATGQDPGQDPFIARYLLAWLPVDIAPGVTVDLPIGRAAVGLAAAQLRQEAGDIAGAVLIAESLAPTTPVTATLAQLYVMAGRFGDVIRVTEGVTNDDDTTAFLLVQRAIAFRRQGLTDAALEVLKLALRSRTRAVQVRLLALSERSATYAAQGRTSMARKDLERILAEDSVHEGIRERLAELASLPRQQQAGRSADPATA
jgi:tetratricopeptide (TPR) repeat protein